MVQFMAYGKIFCGNLDITLLMFDITVNSTVINILTIYRTGWKVYHIFEKSKMHHFKFKKGCDITSIGRNKFTKLWLESVNF